MFTVLGLEHISECDCFLFFMFTPYSCFVVLPTKTKEKLSDNIKAFMNTIQSLKPETFGKGKKKGSGGGKKSSNNKNAKYYLKAYLTSTQQKGSVNIDLRTIDVSFMFASHIYNYVLSQGKRKYAENFFVFIHFCRIDLNRPKHFSISLPFHHIRVANKFLFYDRSTKLEDLNNDIGFCLYNTVTINVPTMNLPLYSV